MCCPMSLKQITKALVEKQYGVSPLVENVRIVKVMENGKYVYSV